MATAKKLKDFYAGDTKKWAIETNEDLTGSVFVWRMARNLVSPPDVEIEGVFDPPIPPGNTIHRVWFTIPEEVSVSLEPGDYISHHRWKDAQGTVVTFLQKEIAVLPAIPKGQAVI